ncbi:hypothetical protein [Paraburkholderia silvatlantica]|uniref:hypothetical protein n=1 Tax=Paraburkholderia silvatlantica TaxID=321895 RepID=UPI003750C3CF
MLSTDAIGGYFELELPRVQRLMYAHANRYQSARASFFALLQAKRPAKVWMPRYICDCMLEPLVRQNIEFERYSIDEEFLISVDLELEKDEWLFYVNYFGIADAKVEWLLQRFPRDQVVIDNSQAFFSGPRNNLATIYSPRKFFGVPDGGMLVSNLEVPTPEEQDIVSSQRVAHLLNRLGGTAESGYADYQRAEATLDDMVPRRMSQLTEKMLTGIDFQHAKARRLENFQMLHRHLDTSNALSIDMDSVSGPLCYPFVTDRAGLRQKLIAQRIFVATYWPDVLVQPLAQGYERQLASQCLPLPCDQRYTTSDMARILDVIAG